MFNEIVKCYDTQLLIQAFSVVEAHIVQVVSPISDGGFLIFEGIDNIAYEDHTKAPTSERELRII